MRAIYILSIRITIAICVALGMEEEHHDIHTYFLYRAHTARLQSALPLIIQHNLKTPYNNMTSEQHITIRRKTNTHTRALLHINRFIIVWYGTCECLCVYVSCMFVVFFINASRAIRAQAASVKRHTQFLNT